MRYAIVSDVHGNINALQSVLNHTTTQNIDGYIFVGDYFGDFPYPNEVVDTIKNIHNNHVISGNKEGYLIDLHNTSQDDWVHNQFNAIYWSYNELRKDNLDYLMQLPTRKEINCNNGKKALLLHSITDLFKETSLDILSSSKYAQLIDEKHLTHNEFLEYIKDLLLNDEKFLKELDAIDSEIIIFGHTHLQWYVNINGKTLINAGSCGLPLDLTTTAPYTILDIELDEVSVYEHRVEYNINTLVSEIKKSALYKNAEDWCNIIIPQLTLARDQISFFFQHVWKIAKKNNNTKWPIDNNIWSKAIKSWQPIKTTKK
ncbi:MAG: metallophosphatase family protein [Vallitalea sp.]|jgi:predicted phosphodiesterase|nr:metallophosphatase family protein [Vallitalea sp.]